MVGKKFSSSMQALNHDMYVVGKLLIRQESVTDIQFNSAYFVFVYILEYALFLISYSVSGIATLMSIYTLPPPAPWASYKICKIAGCACAGNAGKVFPATAD